MATVAEQQEALAAALVEADPGDPRSLEAVRAALEAVRAAGGLGEPLAAEAPALLAALAGPDPAAALARLGALLEDAEARPHAAPPPAAKAERDAETIELIGDFLQESDEGLSRADDLLLAVEKGGPDAEKVNALFRVFHTIKGVAGFLELTEIVSLAHTTENLLNAVRDGRLALEGDAFDVTFESTARLRTLLGSLRSAVDAGLAVAPDAEVAPLVARIQAVSARAEAEVEEPAPAAAPAPSPAAAAPAPTPAAAPTPAVAPAPAGAPQPAPAAAPAAAAEEAWPEDGAPAPLPPGEKAAPAFVVRPVKAPVDAGTGAAVAAPTGGGQLRETVKVDLERVDSMVEMIGELIIVESMVVHAPELAKLGSLKLRNYLNQLTKISRDLQNVAMRMRMVPVRGVFQKMARLVRDLSRKTGKDVVLETEGEDTEMDRAMVEKIEDPLVHLVRNALDHGVETADERRASGKPARSVLRLAAYHEGGSIVVELADDGRGMHREKILKKAREKGLVEDGKALSDGEVHALIFLPGFSTAAKVTEISGRGVGMDVVKRNVEEMRGRVSVSSQPGAGSSFRMVLPLTLAIIDGMLIASGSEKYIIPSLSIIESLRPSNDMVSRAAGRGEIVNVRGEILPLLRLHRLLEMSGTERPLAEAHVVVVEGLGKKVGLVVDDVLTQQQVVIKPLGSALCNTDFLSGAAILSDGRVGLILNVDKLASLARTARPREVAAGA